MEYIQAALPVRISCSPSRIQTLLTFFPFRWYRAVMLSLKHAHSYIENTLGVSVQHHYAESPVEMVLNFRRMTDRIVEMARRTLGVRTSS